MQINKIAILFITACFSITGFLANDAQAQEKPTITFSRLLARTDGTIDIGVAPEDFRVGIIELMRARGFNVLGAESLLFDQDKSQQARLVIGGVVQRLECKRIYHGLEACNVAVNWELFDRKERKVIYQNTTTNRIEYRNLARYQKENFSDWLFGLVKGSLLIFFSDAGFQSATNGVAANIVSDRTFPIATFARCNVKPIKLPKKMSDVMNATVIIKSGGGTGSGVFISNDGILLTAAHVVEGLKEVTVVTHSGREFKAKVLRQNRNSDVAVLQVNTTNTSCLTLKTDLPNAGEETYAIGAPAGEELSFSVSRGIVSGTREFEGEKFIQTDTSINPGNSGGPLVNSNGQIVGIVSWKIVNTGFEGLGFAVPSTIVQKRLFISSGNTTNIKAHTPAALCPAGEVALRSGHCIPGNMPTATTPTRNPNNNRNRNQNTRPRNSSRQSQSSSTRKPYATPDKSSDYSSGKKNPHFGLIYNFFDTVVGAVFYGGFVGSLNLQAGGDKVAFDVYGCLASAGGELGGYALVGPRFLPMGKGLKGFFITPRIGGGILGFLINGELGYTFASPKGHFLFSLGGGVTYAIDGGPMAHGMFGIGFGG